MFLFCPTLVWEHTVCILQQTLPLKHRASFFFVTNHFVMIFQIAWFWAHCVVSVSILIKLKFKGMFIPCYTYWVLLVINVRSLGSSNKLDWNIGVKLWPKGQIWPSGSLNITCESIHNHCYSWPANITQHNTQHDTTIPRMFYWCFGASVKTGWSLKDGIVISGHGKRLLTLNSKGYK